MSNRKQIDEAQFSKLIAACSGSWSSRCDSPPLPDNLARIEEMPGYAASFFSGSLASAEYPKVGQVDAFREELTLQYGDPDRVRKYSWTFYHEPDPARSGSMIIVVREVPASRVVQHHAAEMAEEFFEQFAAASPGKKPPTT